MAEGKRDDNRVVTMIGVSSVDGTTPIAVVIDSVTNRMLVVQSASGAHGAVTNREIAVRDDNRVPVMIGTSSADDGTLVQAVVESGNLRLKND